jgi:hypothetical protein
MKRSTFVRGDEKILIPLLGPLFEDVVECEELLEKSDTQFARRAFVRAAFAFNEGLIYWFKGIVQELMFANAGTKGLNIDALFFLDDRKPRLNQRGKIEHDDNRVSFMAQCALVLRMAAEQRNIDPEKYFGDNGWNELQKSLIVRHRITHPKQPENLDISDEDLQSVSEGHRWLHNCLADVTVNASRDKS